MKTISEAKSDYAISIPDEIITKQDIIEQRMDSFDAGVEFCQTWIPVEEELPTEFPIDIIAKYGGRYKAFCVENEVSVNYLKNVFTYWRPIERK